MQYRLYKAELVNTCLTLLITDTFFGNFVSYNVNMIIPVNVNIQDATELGTDMLCSFYNDMPSGFYDSIRERVTTVETARRE